MHVVNDFFEGRIEISDGNAKFADMWLIENIWGMMKEKTIENLDSLVDLNGEKLHLTNVKQ